MSVNISLGNITTLVSVPQEHVHDGQDLADKFAVQCTEEAVDELQAALLFSQFCFTHGSKETAQAVFGSVDTAFGLASQ
ncbi:hypothetical protein FB645_006148, partial [Coemansia sp. IMI 203386]